MSHDQHETPVRRPVWTPSYRTLTLAGLIALFLIAVRFVVGLGPMTNMTDVFPWGTWKIFNVIVLTALGSGGYALAFVVYVLNRGRYHSLVRHALLTSAVGYTMGLVALATDIGRPWNFWRVLVQWDQWNLDSVLLEVAVCVTAYVGVLWIEMSPALMERWRHGGHQGLANFSAKAIPAVEKALPWIIGLGLVLPTMHQSSLGSLYLLAGHKVHPLWFTPAIPLLFLLSCWIMGYAMVITTYILASRRYRRPGYDELLSRLSMLMGGIILAFGLIRLFDIVWRGQLDALFTVSWHSALVFVELGLTLIPGVLLLVDKKRRGQASSLFRLAFFILLGGMFYRTDAGWFAFDGGVGAVYFPSVPELVMTVGLIALQGMIYLFIVKSFPILTAPATSPARG